MSSLSSKLDITTVVLWMLLVAAGLVAIYSTTHGAAAELYTSTPRQNFDRQVMWLGISLVAVIAVLMLPIRFFQLAAFPAYALTILLLLAALVFGREINGAKAWLAFGPVQFQVSEFAKVGTVLALAQLVGMRRPKTMGLSVGLSIVGIAMLPAVIILLQNDTGTALVFLGLIPIVLFWSGLGFDILLLMLAPAVAGYLSVVHLPSAVAFSLAFAALMWWRTRDKRVAGLAALFAGGTTAVASFAMAKLLQPYQLARVLSFTDPGAAEFRDNAGFHQLQSMAAIGSGGLAGKGFLEGTQTQGAYVPEQSTDFIFSVIGEEFGFVGAVLLLVFFLALLIRLLTLGARMKHPFGVMAAAGAAGIYLIHMFVNIGMATSMLPVIGIPLPFVSYGGSALLANSVLLAIVVSLHMRRDDFSIYGY
ncbi:MAG: rod shape-determining protein RodA [Bacteroidetes bacterium CG12_big_fil_rev_8_21_14_0_65_60_17]|nr:MAG: rod shape-determining protein RodA [Bacteroidetes bacterium CG12_big_fil_rev_8_21_14_0_65_60_17]